MDVDSQKKIEFLEKIITKLPGLVFCKDLNGAYLACNEAQARIIGLSTPDEVIGKTDFDLLDKEEANKLWSIDKQIMSGQLFIDESNPIEETIILPDGRVAVFEAIKVLIYDNDGKVMGLAGIAKDITERKKMEEDLRRAMIAAEAGNKAKSEFIASMSHDIRTPLSGILGIISGLINVADETCVALQQEKSTYSTDILEKYLSLLNELIEVVREDGQLILGSADELLQLLNEILETMSLESGKVPEQAESFSLHELVEHNIELMRPVARHKKLTLICEMDEKIPSYVNGFHRYLDRTLLNLLSNALKFTEKGFVKIKLQLLNSPQSGFVVGDRIELKIVIEDSGIGIPQDKFETIFENFSRLTPSYQGLYKGAGLGLYTVKRYIEAMQATIDLESEVGKGSCFTIKLPLIVSDHSDREKISYRTPEKKKDKPIQAAQKNTAKASINTEATVRILMVEDNLIAAKAAQSTIRHLYRDCACDRAETGQEAINLAQQNVYDFILMDIGLPDIDGIEATRQIRALSSRKHAQVPIIALTGHGSNWDKKEQALAAGMNEVFEKPLTESKLELLMQHFVFNPKQNEGSIEKTHSEKAGIQNIIPVIDWNQCLEQFNGDEAVVRELLVSLAMDLKLSQEKIAELYAANNEEALRAELHRLNGGIVYFSLPQLSQTLAAFHEAVKAKLQQAKRLEATYAAFHEAINTFLTTVQQNSFKKA